mgnify:FL=1
MPVLRTIQVSVWQFSSEGRALFLSACLTANGCVSCVGAESSESVPSSDDGKGGRQVEREVSWIECLLLKCLFMCMYVYLYVGTLVCMYVCM